MELSLVIAILSLVVSTIIALASLAYAIKQRNVVKKEISKKRYLESALSSLNETIKSLRDIDIPNVSNLRERHDAWHDDYFDAYMIGYDVLKASFDLKKKKIALQVSYQIRDSGERGKPISEKDERTIQNFDEFNPEWFINLLRLNRHLWTRSTTRINSFDRSYQNELGFDMFIWSLEVLHKATKQLLNYEEVYETVSPDSVKKANKLFEEIAEEIFKTIQKPKRIEIDLDKFAKTDEIIEYLFEEILNFSHIAEKFSKVSEVISELKETRKALFLKIS